MGYQEEVAAIVRLIKGLCGVAIVVFVIRCLAQFKVKAAQAKAAQEKAAREKAAQEKAAREKAARDKAAREKAAQENAAREKAARDKAAREKAAQEKAAQDKAAREKVAQEKAAREKAERARERRREYRANNCHCTEEQRWNLHPGLMDEDKCQYCQDKCHEAYSNMGEPGYGAAYGAGGNAR